MESCAHQDLGADRTLLTCQHITMHVRDDGVCVCDVIVDAGNDGLSVHNIMADVHNIMTNVGNDYICVY